MADASITRPSEAAQRYASALFELAQDSGQLAEVNRDFAAFAASVRGSEDLRRLLNSPAFSREDKGRALAALAKSAGLVPLLGKFLGVMAANGRARDAMGAQRAFDQLYAAQRGIKRAIARTAKAMTPAQRKKLEDILSKSVGGEIDLSEEVDPDLIGGLQLRVGSTLIDASIAAKLERMNSAMKGA
ncbi:MAG: ATP synthase F1 subunit delta [Pseudomonadota bacterium]